jgi:site-specific recombinase XerD
MGRKKLVIKQKEPIKIRTKALENGNFSLYLEQYKGNGKREKEYLHLYLKPELTPFDKATNAETWRAAEAIKAQRIKDLLSEGAGLKKAGRSKVFLHDWLDHVAADRKQHNAGEGHSRNTWARMVERTAVIVTDYAGDTIRLCDVDRDFVKGFINYLQNDFVTQFGTRAAPKTAQKYYSCLRFALNEALRDGIITANPCNLLAETDKIHVPESTREYLNIEELQRLAATQTKSSSTRTAFLFMCFCGLRISDVKALKWGDIEKEGENWRARIRQQKTKEPLYLELGKQARKFIQPQGDKTASDRIFDLTSEPSMNRALKRWAAAAGINKNVTLHTGRHTFATMELTKGADLYTVSKLLGHTEVGTTQIYAKIINNKKREAVALLDGVLNEGRGSDE